MLVVYTKPTPHKLSVKAQVCNSIAQEVEEAGGSEVQDHPQLHRESDVSLGIWVSGSTGMDRETQNRERNDFCTSATWRYVVELQREPGNLQKEPLRFQVSLAD